MENSYDALLDRFKAEYHPRYGVMVGLSKSAKNDHEVFATDGHICVYVRRDKCEGEYSRSKTIDAHSVLDKAEKCSIHFKADMLMAKIEADGMMSALIDPEKCGVCNGDKTLKWKVEDENGVRWEDVPCEQCDGTGNKGFAARSVQFIDGMFQMKYLKMVFDTATDFGNGDVECIGLGNGAERPYIFKINDDIKIALMGLRYSFREGDYRLWLKS